MYFRPVQYPFAPLDSDRHEVIVAGGGPVGLAAAIGLARRGVQVVVLEDDDSACQGSRAICFSRHSLEVLDRLGAGAALTARALPWFSGRSYYRDVEVLRFEMPHAAGDPHPPMVNISQSEAEQVLIDTALDTPGLTMAWQHRVTEVLPDEGGVSLQVRTPQGRRDLRADWLVAADGARSVVRDWLGLQLAGTTYSGQFLIADIHWVTAARTERRAWFDPPVSPGQTVLLHRQPDDIWRFDVQLPVGADPLAELAPQRVKSLVKRHLDWIGNTAPWTLEWSSTYSARAMSLESYRHGRVVFAGDSAHLVPVFGVRGLNSGLEDADTLSWTLASVVRGTASEALLDAYAVERRAAWQENIASANLSTLFMSPPTDGYRVTREAVLALSTATARPELSELINPRQTQATHARTSPLTIAALAGGGLEGGGFEGGGFEGGGGEDDGARLLPGDPVPDVPLAPADGPGLGDGGLSRLSRLSSLNAERGPDFTLLRFGDGTRGAAPAGRLEEFAAALRSLLAPAVGVRVLRDSDGELAKALGGAPGEIFVIRPDGLLLGRFASLDALGDPGALARHVLGGGRPRRQDGQDGAGGQDGAAGEAFIREPSARERMWRTLSDALDAVPADNREAFLTRLTLLLALRSGDPAVFAGLVAEARDSIAPPR
jgi:3-(3-hydroxy-phenyl)propionate hydroxylase